MISQEESPLGSDRAAVEKLQILIPAEDTHKLNNNTPGPIWMDWLCSITGYIWINMTCQLYQILHAKHQFNELLGRRWATKDEKMKWILCLNMVWGYRVSIQLAFFAWLVVYQGLPTKARLVNSSFTDAH